jgi:hypothetical protein
MDSASVHWGRQFFAGLGQAEEARREQLNFSAIESTQCCSEEYFVSKESSCLCNNNLKTFAQAALIPLHVYLIRFNFS